MKVANILGSLNAGGAEMLVLNTLRIADRYPIDMCLVHRKDGILLNEFNKTNRNIYHINNASIVDKLLYVYRLRKLIKQHSINIIHSHQAMDAFITFVATIGLNVKRVFTLHGHGINDSFFLKAVRILALNTSHKNIFVSKSLYNYYCSNFNLKDTIRQTVLYNGIPTEKIISNRTNVSHKNRLKLAMIGNFTSVRDHETVCKFLLKLDALGYDFEFLFIGARSEKEKEVYDNCIALISKLIEKRKVVFTGYRSDVYEILADIDAFVYSSDHDTFGIAVVEAMLSGVPVIVNDWEVMKEISFDGQYAVLYETKNENDLLNRFIHFYNNQDKYKDEARTNVQKIKEFYDISYYMKNINSVYESLI